MPDAAGFLMRPVYSGDMSSTPIRDHAQGYLQEARATVVAQLAGLDDYQIRRPMTVTGTNLLGVVKHLIGIEAGYLGVCLDRPWRENLPWIDAAEPNADMWATADESRGYIIDLYQEVSRHSDAVLVEVGSEHPGHVLWWPEHSRSTTAGALLARVLKDTAMHAGQLQILRELIDGSAGSDRGDLPDDWWAAHVARLESIAFGFHKEPESGSATSSCQSQ